MLLLLFQKIAKLLAPSVSAQEVLSLPPRGEFQPLYGSVTPAGQITFFTNIFFGIFLLTTLFIFVRRGFFPKKSSLKK